MALTAILTDSPAGPTPIAIEYPLDGSVFPPEFQPPTFLWRDPSDASVWRIDVVFDGGGPLRIVSQEQPMRPAEIDVPAIGPTNVLPSASPAHGWIPDKEAWSAIKQNSVDHPATIIGFRDPRLRSAVSEGRLPCAHRGTRLELPSSIATCR